MNRTPRHIVNIAIEQDGYNSGVKDAEERIIKLLEEMFEEWVDIRLETLIDLIRGDNK